MSIRNIPFLKLSGNSQMYLLLLFLVTAKYVTYMIVYLTNILLNIRAK